MKLAVLGGVTKIDARSVDTALDTIQRLHGIDILAHGCEQGAQEFARLWSIAQGIPNIGFPTNPISYGKQASSIRNHTLLKRVEPDLVLVFNDGAEAAKVMVQAERLLLEVVEL